MRLSRIAARSSAEAATTAGSPGSTRSSWSERSAGPSQRPRAASTSSATSSGCAAGRSPPPASVSSSDRSRASRSVSCSAAVSSRSTSGSRLLSAAASRRSRRPVSGVRSWCDAFATNSRCPRSVLAMRSVMSLKAVATSRCSAEPSTLARASRSPWATRPAVPARLRSGFASEPASSQATARPSSSATAPTPTSASTSFRCSVFTASTLWVTRTAPAARPFTATGMAVKRRSSSSRSLWRSPWVGRPWSALRISGRLP